MWSPFHGYTYAGVTRIARRSPGTFLRRLGVVAVAALVVAALQLAPDPSPAQATASGQALGAEARTFFAVADSHVRSDEPTTNFGRSSEMIIEGRPSSRAFFRFYPRGAGSLVQARLRMFVKRKPGKLFIHRTDGKVWSERKITFRNAPRPGPPAGFPEAVRTGWLELDVTALVRLNQRVTIVLTRSSPQKLAIATRESGARAPRLVIETERPGVPAIAAAGDVACNPEEPHFNRGLGTPRHCRMQATSEVLRSLKPDAILGLGDNVNGPGTLDAFMGAYDPAWGKLKHLIRPIPGDEEYRVPGAAGYFQYFGSAAGDPLKGYYSFDIGSWHLVALNSNCRQIGGCRADDPQAEWLRADLAASRARCTLAYTHHPRFSSASDSDFPRIDSVWRLLADNGVELVLSGNHHFYERLAPLNADGALDEQRGLRQFVVGTGGHSSSKTGSPRQTSVARNGDTFGVLRVSLHADGYDWRFIPEVGQSFSDRGTASCH